MVYTSSVGEESQTRASDLQLFRDVFNASPIGIAVESLEGQPLLVNPALCSMLGFSEEELRRKHCVDFSPPEDAQKDWELFQRLKAGSIDHYRLEKRYFRRDGSLMWGQLSLSLVNSRPSPLVLAMVEDITERKRAEEALRVSEERLRLTQQAARTEIFEWNIRTGVDTWTPELEKMYGLPPGGFGGTATAFENLVHPDDRAMVIELDNFSLKTGKPTKGEWRVVWPDGSVHWIAGSWQVFMNESGEPSRMIGVNTDVTERKTAEEALRASEERLRLAQQAARIGTFEWNIQTGVNTWTPELEAMYGLPRGGFGGTQTAFENLVHADDRARVIELVDWALKTGLPTKGEWRVVCPDGSVHWIAGRWQVYMDESRQPSRMVGINIDITDRKLAEERLARANERLHLAVESGSVGGWDWDIKSGKTHWFGKAHAQLGMAPDETPGSLEEFRDHVHQDDREHLQHAMLIAKAKHENFAEDFRVVWRDGTTHWLRSRGRYYYTAIGEPERMLGISIDITQSKQAEQALRESEQRFRLAAQAGKMYSFEWDVTTDAVVRSPEHVRVLGATEPLRSSHQQFVDTIHPDDRPQVIATIAGLTPENPTAEVIFRVRGSDGALVWLKSSGRGFFDGMGRMLRVIGMVSDITDLKRAEEALAGMTRKLIESQEQERARIGRELHDDINQRLAMLAVELEQLQQNPSQIENRVQELRERIAELSDDVQALSHDLHSSKLEYLGVVSGMKSWCKEFAERQKMEIDFRSDVSTALPLDIGLSMFRVLQEALHNVIKHSGVRRVKVQLREDSSGVHLVINDSGKGFNPEAALRGKGLGLTSMRERVRLVNGTIAVHSKPMGGTTIHVCVPLGLRRTAEEEAV